MKVFSSNFSRDIEIEVSPFPFSMRLRHPKKGSTEISKLALKFGET